jgi:hypothetical protein
VTLSLVTTCDLATILQRMFFNLLHKIIRSSDIIQFSDSFCGDQKCHKIEIALYIHTSRECSQFLPKNAQVSFKTRKNQK